MRRLGTVLFAVALAAMANVALAQGTFPARPVRMVVGFAPGGGTDIIARLVAQKLGERVERIQRDASALLNSPDMKQSLAAQGCIAVGGTPEALSALIRSEYQLWSKVVKAGGIRVE